MYGQQEIGAKAMRPLRTIVMSRFAIFQMQRRDAPRFEIDWYIYHRARRKILDVRRMTT
jgi:hypothetical protein